MIRRKRPMGDMSLTNKGNFIFRLIILVKFLLTCKFMSIKKIDRHMLSRWALKITILTPMCKVHVGDTRNFSGKKKDRK